MVKSLFQKIIVAVNGSEQSLSAAMYAIMMAKQYGCELKAVYVVDTATLKQLELLRFLYSEERNRYEEKLLSDGKRNLSLVSRLAAEKKVKVEEELCSGAVWSEIVRAADDFSADLILLGGKTANGSSRHDRVSSANSEIIGSASKNVLVVKEIDIEKKFRIL